MAVGLQRSGDWPAARRIGRWAAPKCTKFDFGGGSVPDPAGGAYNAPPDPIAGFKGPTSKGREGKGREGREWEWTGGDGKGWDGTGWEGREGKDGRGRTGGEWS